MFKDLFNGPSKKGITAQLGDDLKKDDDDYELPSKMQPMNTNLNGTIGKGKSMKKDQSKKDLKNKFSSSAAVNEEDFNDLDFDEDRVEDDAELRKEKIMLGVELGQDAMEEQNISDILKRHIQKEELIKNKVDAKDIDEII